MARPTNTKALLQAEKAIEEAQARRDQLLQGFHLKAGERLVDLLGVEGVDDALAALEKGLKAFPRRSEHQQSPIVFQHHPSRGRLIRQLPNRVFRTATRGLLMLPSRFGCLSYEDLKNGPVCDSAWVFEMLLEAGLGFGKTFGPADGLAAMVELGLVPAKGPEAFSIAA